MIANESSFLVLYCDNTLSTKDFYTKIGAIITEYEDNKKCVVNLGGNSLHFIHTSNEPFDEYKPFTKKSSDHSVRGQGILIYLEVKNISEFYNLVKSLSARIYTEIKDNHWDYKEFAFSDPNGITLVAYGE